LSEASYFLDTNISSDCIRTPRLDAKLESLAIGQVAISSITEAELRYGLAKRPEAIKLRAAVDFFLATVQIMNFDSNAATSYGNLRHRCEQVGLSIGSLDGLIAAHAHSLQRTLITRDKSLLRLKPWLNVLQW
jgi:tRNA(fMet)-specific endonuclease VapC